MKKYMLVLVLLALNSYAVEPAVPEVSQKLPLTEPLKKGALPWFVSRDRNDLQQFSKKHLEEIVNAQTKRVALVFFASWCIPCKNGIVRLRDNQEELDKQGVQIVLVNTGENDISKIEAWVKTNGNDKWTVILDKFKNLQKNTGLISGTETEIVFPKTILLDNKLKPLFLIGTEGKDWPSVLWL